MRIPIVVAAALTLASVGAAAAGPPAMVHPVVRPHPAMMVRAPVPQVGPQIGLSRRVPGAPSASHAASLFPRRFDNGRPRTLGLVAPGIPGTPSGRLRTLFPGGGLYDTAGLPYGVAGGSDDGPVISAGRSLASEGGAEPYGDARPTRAIPFLPPAPPNPGPKIIYIGQRPPSARQLPVVVYGTDP